MAKGNNDAKLRELMAKGFSKTKCAQALKDSGNSVTAALKVLERQQQQGGTYQQQHIVGTRNDKPMSGLVSSTAAASIPSLHRARNGPASTLPLTDAQKKLLRQRERRHPCVVQYGSCQYGDFCLLKDFPGDVCVQYFQGCCIYGSSCRHRHYVNGVDVREVLREAYAEEEVALQTFTKDGATYRVQENDGGDSKVRVATLVQREGDCEDVSAGVMMSPADRLNVSQHQRFPFTAVQGHADPFRVENSDDDEVQDGVEGGDCENMATHHPTPFLDRARAGPARANNTTAATVNRSNINVVPAVQLTSTKAISGGGTRLSRRRHPCIAQYGSCKYGDACLYADRDADVCLHFLRGGCRFSAEECKYRHESTDEYEQSLRVRAGLPDTSSIGEKEEAAVREKTSSSTTTTTTTAATARATPPKNRLQGVGMVRNCSDDHDGSSNHIWREGDKGEEAAKGASSPSLPQAFLPVDNNTSVFTTLLSTSNSQTEMFEGDHADPSISDAETHVFFGLLEAYPTVEPLVVLQVLRLCGGDPLKMSDMLSQFDTSLSSSEVEGLAAALAMAAADEAAEQEEAAAAAQYARAMERHNALLTLLMLFPSTEVTAVEAVLSKQKDDFAAAYNVLLCAQEKMARTALWNGSSAALRPADQLRVEKLQAMFPGLHPEIVQSAFCATGQDWSATTTALNELTKELLSLETVEVPTRPVVWHPPTSHAAAVSAREKGSGAQENSHSPGPSMTESSEEAYEAYRRAEKEILSYGDWRQVRQQAYLINSQRIRVLGQASAAFHQNDGRTAKLLSREGHRMAVEYNRLNRMAMLALEQERLRTDATSTLDLHGFHAAEVHDVVLRRVEVCQRRQIRQLRIVVGEGLHSRRGHRSLYTVLMEELRTDAYLKSTTKVKSIKPGYVDVAILLPAKSS